jgi:serine/threonine-protein kinase RsbW
MLVRHFLRQHDLPELAFSTELVVRECLNNAINHGNRRDPRKRIRLFVVAEKKSVRVTVEDDGDGFNWKEYRTARLPDHTKTAGRGLAVVASYARNFEFNRKGNVISVEITRRHGRRGKR